VLSGRLCSECNSSSSSSSTVTLLGAPHGTRPTVAVSIAQLSSQLSRGCRAASAQRKRQRRMRRRRRLLQQFKQFTRLHSDVELTRPSQGQDQRLGLQGIIITSSSFLADRVFAAIMYVSVVCL